MSEQPEIIYSNIIKIQTHYSPNLATVGAKLVDQTVRVKSITMTFEIAGSRQKNVQETTITRKWGKNDKDIVLVRAVLLPWQGDRHFTVTKIVAHLPKGETAQIEPPTGYSAPSPRSRIVNGIRNLFGCLKK